MKRVLFINGLFMLLITVGFTQQYQNLVLNPAAQNQTMDYWNISSDGGDGWAITGAGGIDDSPCFITSYDWGYKSQTIDLLALGYNSDVLNNAPIVLFSEKYKGRDNGSSTADLYHLYIELRDGSGNILASFNSGIMTCSNDWQTIKGTFRNYGSGLRYIYYEHGGSGVNFWAGHYGAMMDDSHVSIVNNVYYAGGKTHSFSGWEITENYGDGWIIDGNGWYRTSWDSNTKHQMIDLIDLGYTAAELDSQPYINVGEWVKGTSPNYADYYWMTIELLNENMEILDEYILDINTTENWEWVGSMFDNYGSGLRYIKFEHGGVDTEFWLGHYGTTMDYAFVDIDMNNTATGIISSTETAGMEMAVYPNPAIDHFTIKLSQGKWTNVQLFITDLSGKTVYNEDIGDISNQIFYKNMALKTLNKGMYVVNIVCDQGTKTTKLIIE